jgi:hypothetical protein
MLSRTRCEAIGAMRTSQKSEIFVESDELKDRVLPCSYPYLSIPVSRAGGNRSGRLTNGIAAAASFWG